MIVIYKETIGDSTLVNMPTMELVETIKYGTIDKEVKRLRELYGVENELIKGRNSDDVCLVYDRYKYYVMKC